MGVPCLACSTGAALTCAAWPWLAALPTAFDTPCLRQGPKTGAALARRSACLPALAGSCLPALVCVDTPVLRVCVDAWPSAGHICSRTPACACSRLRQGTYVAMSLALYPCAGLIRLRQGLWPYVRGRALYALSAGPVSCAGGQAPCLCLRQPPYAGLVACCLVLVSWRGLRTIGRAYVWSQGARHRPPNSG